MLFVLLLSFSSVLASAPPPKYDLVGQSNVIRFEFIDNDIPIKGEFRSFSNVHIAFDENNLSDSKVDVEVSLHDKEKKRSTVVSNNRYVKKYIELKEWLDSTIYPYSRFISEAITINEGDQKDKYPYLARGQLSIKGKTLPATIFFNMKTDDHLPKNKIANGELTINIRDYKIGTGAWGEGISDKVKLDFYIVLHQKESSIVNTD